MAGKKKRKKLSCMTSVHDCAHEQNGNPYFSSTVRRCKWPSWQIVEVQKFCDHGNVRSHFTSQKFTASIIIYIYIYINEFVLGTPPFVCTTLTSLSLFISYLVVLSSSTLCNVCLSSCRYHVLVFCNLVHNTWKISSSASVFTLPPRTWDV